MRIDFTDPAISADPFTFYGRIREQGRLVRGDIPGMDPLWVATGYEQVKTVMNDPRFVNDVSSVPGSDAPDLTDQMLQALGISPEYRRFIRPGLADLDGAAHSRLRSLVAKTFTARRVTALRPRITEITTALLDALPDTADANGVVDLLRDFAYPLPITVICELVGIPEEYRPQWRKWGAVFGQGFGAGMDEAIRGIADDTRRLIEHHRAEPANDLLSGLLHPQDAQADRLDDTELITMVVSLVMAGHETTAHLISNGTAALLKHREQWDLLVGNPEAVPAAIDELMRWCSPGIGTRMRYATTDLELGGVTVAKGEAVMPILAAANRDPAGFDDPERLDITRAGSARHVGFGHGVHRCLGAALAKQEGEVAFTALTRRHPNLRLAVPADELPRGANPGSWQLAALPVRL